MRIRSGLETEEHPVHLRDILPYLVLGKTKNPASENAAPSFLEELLKDIPHEAKEQVMIAHALLIKTEAEVRIRKEKSAVTITAEDEAAVRTTEKEKVSIRYERTETEETLTITKGGYEVAAARDIPSSEKPKPYALAIAYTREDSKEKLEVTYSLPVTNYPEREEDKRQDFTARADKTLHIIPKSMMGGVLGFTYLGENYMARRDDLIGEMARMVDVHEAIHTPDEYETRILTDWMLTREKPRYVR